MLEVRALQIGGLSATELPLGWFLLRTSAVISVPRPSGQTQELERLRLGTSAEPVFMAVVAEGPAVCLAFHPQIGLRRGVIAVETTERRLDRALVGGEP